MTGDRRMPLARSSAPMSRMSRGAPAQRTAAPGVVATARKLVVVGMAGKLLALGALVSVSADEGVNNFFDLTAIDIRGQPHPFEQYRGNVVLAVNVATD